jgi:hypothetical protein
MKKNISKEEWVAMYRDIGLDRSKMEHWHRLFESCHPDAQPDCRREYLRPSQCGVVG